MADAKLTALSAGAAITAATLIYGVQSAASVKISGSNLIAGTSLEFNGAGGLQVAAFTGDVTKAAGGVALTIPNDTVTYAKMQNVSAASKLLGRGSAGGAGDPEEITLGTGLSMSGTTLNSSGGSGTPGGSDTQVQFNDAGAFGGDTVFVWNKTNNRLTIGHTTNLAVLTNNRALQIHGTGSETGITLGQWSADAVGNEIVLFKSRGAIGTTTVVADLDLIGTIAFAGASDDGTHQTVASIKAYGLAPLAHQIGGGMQFHIKGRGDVNGFDVWEFDGAGRMSNGSGWDLTGFAQIPFFYFWQGDASSFTPPGNNMGINPFAKHAYRNNSAGFQDYWFKSRNNVKGGHTIVQANDDISYQAYFGSDGSSVQRAADHLITVEGTPAAGDIRARFSWRTGIAGTMTEKVRIDSDGCVTFRNATTSAFVVESDMSVLSGASAQYKGFGNVSIGAFEIYTKTRGATLATQTIVNSGDNLLWQSFRGSDGVAYQEAALIQVQVDGSPAAGSMPGRLLFYTTPAGSTGGVERLRIDNGGRVIIREGGGAGTGGIVTGQLQILGMNTGPSSMLFGRWSNDASCAFFEIAKSRGTTIGTPTVVQTNDVLGIITFSGANGSFQVESATITAEVDAAPSGFFVPGRLIFKTAPAGNVGVERLRIDSVGTATFTNGASNTLVITKTDSTYNGISFSGAPGSFGTWTGFEAGDGTDKVLYYNVQTGAKHSFSVAGTEFFSIGATLVQVKTSNTNFVVGAAALATNATDGFPYIPSCAGTPIGTPTAFTGRVPLIVDTTGSKLWGYFGGAWTSLTGAGGGGSPGGSNTQVQFNDSGSFGGGTTLIWNKTNGILGVGGPPNLSVLLSGAVNGVLQVMGTSGEASMSVQRYSNGTTPGRVEFAKSRGTTLGSMTIVQNGDQLGEITFEGANGTLFDVAASISGEVDATPGASNDMPGRLVFKTSADGSATPTERLRIDNAGQVTLQNGTTITGHVNETVAEFNHIAFGGL